MVLYSTTIPHTAPTQFLATNTAIPRRTSSHEATPRAPSVHSVAALRLHCKPHAGHAQAPHQCNLYTCPHTPTSGRGNFPTATNTNTNAHHGHWTCYLKAVSPVDQHAIPPSPPIRSGSRVDESQPPNPRLTARQRMPSPSPTGGRVQPTHTSCAAAVCRPACNPRALARLRAGAAAASTPRRARQRTSHRVRPRQTPIRACPASPAQQPVPLFASLAGTGPSGCLPAFLFPKRTLPARFQWHTCTRGSGATAIR